MVKQINISKITKCPTFISGNIRKVVLFRNLKDTVKHLISAVSKFGSLLKMTYWWRLILAVMNAMFQENKQNVM